MAAKAKEEIKEVIDVGERIERALTDHRRYATIVVWLSVAIFLLGVTGIVIGLMQKNAFIVVPATAMGAFLYWPIDKILRIRKDNLLLVVTPSLIAELPPERAAEQIIKLVEKMIDG